MANPWDNDEVVGQANPWDADPVVQEPKRKRAEAPKRIDPTDGMPWWQQALAGVGKSAVDTGRGVMQVGSAIADQIPGVDLSGYRQGLQAEIDESRRIDAPLMNRGWGVVGNVAGQAAQMAVPVAGGAKLTALIGKASPYAGAATRAAGFTALQPMATGQDRATEAAKAGALGAAGAGVAQGIGRLAARTQQAMSGPVQQSIELAKRAGIPLHLSQVTDSRFLKGLQAVTSHLPFTGAGKAAQNQQQAFNRALGRSFGADDAGVLSDDVMKAARNRLNAEYGDIYSKKVIAISDAPLRRMVEIEREAIENLTDDEARVVTKQLEKILSRVGDGELTGNQYQALRTSLSGVAPGTNLGRYVKALRDTLDETAQTALGPDDAARLAKIRGQWANLRTTEDALKQVAGAGGNVAPTSLWPLIRKGSTKEMRELAKIGQNVLKNPIPNSGTPERDLILRMLGAGGAGAAGGMAMPVVAKTLGAGVGIGRLLNSPGAANLLGQGRPINSLARVAKVVGPKGLPLPAAAMRAGEMPLEIDVTGGTPVSDEEFLRMLREGR